MTPNDKQIDVLIRRFASAAPSAPESMHLDADEISAFAEGALPPAARARYMSHLADCNQCRHQVSDLAIAVGALTRTEQSSADKAAPRRFWESLIGLFALPLLKYAAFGAVLVLVAGVAFVVLRRRPEAPSLVAANEPETQQPVSAVKAPADTNGRSELGKAANSSSPGSPSTVAPDRDVKQEPGRVPDSTTSPLQPMKEAAPVDEAEKKAEQKADQATIAQSKPAYAPAPPGETQGLARGQSETVTVGGGLQTQSAAKAGSADREREVAKDNRLDDASRASNQPSVAMRKAGDDKLKGPSRNMDNVMTNNRSANEIREPPKSVGGAASTEESPQTRSAGGRKFRRQGNSWVDQKFKSSMSLKSVSRSSEDFAALDSGLRSIVQQLSGEVIVVWKGKAYLIK